MWLWFDLLNLSVVDLAIRPWQLQDWAILSKLNRRRLLQSPPDSTPSLLSPPLAMACLAFWYCKFSLVPFAICLIFPVNSTASLGLGKHTLATRLPDVTSCCTSLSTFKFVDLFLPCHQLGVVQLYSWLSLTSHDYAAHGRFWCSLASPSDCFILAESVHAMTMLLARPTAAKPHGLPTYTSISSSL